ncbi:WD repeat and FYVE domain-containing protein 1 [Varanus komodoensis]|nr:WD repeat and FYVE domain-containing protein 1 [Varanus komodoensis]
MWVSFHLSSELASNGRKQWQNQQEKCHSVADSWYHVLQQPCAVLITYNQLVLLRPPSSQRNSQHIATLWNLLAQDSSSSFPALNGKNTFFALNVGSIASLWWDPVQRLLFSGASDNSIIMWDIGGRRGRTLLLQGHHDKVQALCYLQLTRQLVSCSADGGITVWNMDISREEAPQWMESDSCQKCEQPFFWNIKQMWDTKTLGLRQHHCRKCGQAVCGKCSTKRSSYPIMGFEFQVRVCDSCFDSIKDEDRTSLATFHEGKHNISHMSMDISRGLMVTCGSDRVVKIWDMTPVVGCGLATGFASH